MGGLDDGAAALEAAAIGISAVAQSSLGRALLRTPTSRAVRERSLTLP
jgi:hypothetical protein